jgi:DNA modification methylase
MPSVPCLRIRDWSEAQKAAYAIADNKIALNAGWDEALLLQELEALIEIDFDVGITGFDAIEIDGLARAEEPEDAGDPRDDALPEPCAGPPVTRAGDVWLCGEHRLICGDARNPVVYAELMQGEKAELVFTDPPYNVPISGHVGGLGRIRHREFAMPSGEMSEAEFTQFLEQTLGQLAANSTEGSLHFICMDWRHMAELQRAAGAVYTELKNLIVWVKDNGGMGSFYRSRHELIFAFKNGTGSHINNFELGQRGRYRTNVWQYRGVNCGGAKRLEELALHPTVKPVALVADALQDCSRRGGIVLDAFCGSGTILIAAEKTRRRARAVEIDESYCDTAIRRWQAFAHDDAILAATGEAFDEVRRRLHEEEGSRPNGAPREGEPE